MAGPARAAARAAPTDTRTTAPGAGEPAPPRALAGPAGTPRRRRRERAVDAGARARPARPRGADDARTARLPPVHLFVGLLLLPVVSLKLSSTSWRAARYYTGNAEYHALGPPRILLRVLAPVLVGATVTLFGTGVAFLAVSGTHPLRTIHTFAFVVWGAIVALHVLAYLPRVLR